MLDCREICTYSQGVAHYIIQSEVLKDETGRPSFRLRRRHVTLGLIMQIT
jgi:hypothetical protein